MTTTVEDHPTPGARSLPWRIVAEGATAALFVGAVVMLRGVWFDAGTYLNPDEAELIGQARAAMHSPVPFTTWTTATTGPVWALFLALLGVSGMPMTLAAAHLLAAVLLGVLGYLTFTLARRAVGRFSGAVITVFLWLPVVLVLVGVAAEFAPLATELLPALLVMCAAMIRPADLARRPWLYAVSGLLCGLAVGAKYQAAPLAIAALVVHVVGADDFRWRTTARNVGWWAAAAVAPAVVILVAMLLSSDVSWVAVEQNLTFLRFYSKGVTLHQRLTNWRNVVTTMHIALLVLLVCWVGARSAPRTQLCRTLLVLAGFAAVFAGGMPFPHYVHFAYAALAMAIGLPIRPDAQLVPYVRRRWVARVAVALVALAAWTAAFGPPQLPRLTHRSQLATALSGNGGVPRDPGLRTACPQGSRVLVWGWAPELYTYYSWTNAIPYMNTTLLIYAPENRGSGLKVIRTAVEDPSTTCVVDAVGRPFFDPAPDHSLTTYYPEMRPLLDTNYDPIGKVLDCDACAVYVRRASEPPTR